MTDYLVTIERMKDCMRFKRTIEAQDIHHAMRYANQLVRNEPDDYYVISVQSVNVAGAANT